MSIVQLRMPDACDIIRDNELQRQLRAMRPKFPTQLKPRARQFYSRVLDRMLWKVHAPKMYDGCGTTLEGALRVFRANNQLT
jgi:hypothetical protein